MTIVAVGVDLAKNVFAVHGVDETGKVVLLKSKVKRADLLPLLAHSNERSKRLMQICGIAETTSSAIEATVGNGHDFNNGRQFSAWLGLVPRQRGSGGKTQLGRITKAGDPYLRTLLILGARAVLNAAEKKKDRMSLWALEVKKRRGYGKALVAIAAKNARIAWAMLSKGLDYRQAEHQEA